MAVCNYQVFLSFRGPETRDSLVAYLNDRLRRLGIVAFLDREEIKLGASISVTIVKAIKRSDVCVPVFSPDFASSAACLMEVAQMVESQKKILPIFFFVEPREVRHQLGPYEKSFAEHENQGYFPKSTIQKWRDALKKIACNRGPEFKKADLEVTLKAALEVAMGKIGVTCLPKHQEAALKTALETSLGEIGVIRGPKYKAADLEDTLEAAMGKICVIPERECKRAKLGETSVRHGPEIEEADLDAALKAAMEVAQREIGVRHGPESKEGGTKGQFYKDLFNGFRELDDFVSELRILLEMDKQDVTKNLVGRDKDVQDMISKLGFQNQDGQLVEKSKMIGRMVFVVWGIVGVGKTTLAKVVYNKIRHLFDGCSFLENVQGETKNVVSLQNKLIRDLMKGGGPEVRSPAEGARVIKHLFLENRVLIVLDNVDSLEQIKPLAEEFSWFGPGSIIMLTTRTEDIIEHYKDTDLDRREYEVLALQENQALELFNRHAIKPDDVSQEDYNALSKKIIFALGRLPFFIEFVGKYLCGKSKEIWNGTPDQLRGELDKRAVPILKEIYDLFSKNTVEIFLDIACFFVKVEKRNPYHMWVAQRRDPDAGVGELQNRSFLKIGEENEFRMHTPLITFGTQIVKEKDHENPWRRCRLWDCEDLQKTLREKKDRKMVNALRVTPNLSQDAKFKWEELNELPDLRFLDLGQADIQGNIEDVLPNLVWLDWHGCSDKKQLFALSMEKLAILDLCSSKVELSQEAWNTLMGKAKLLKVLNAKDCPLIFASLEFPNPVPLEHLILEGCYLDIPTDSRLTSGLEKLVTLNMKRCTCNNIVLQEALRSLTALKELIIDETEIERLVFMEGSLPALEILSACQCEDLTNVNSIEFLKNLRKLTLRSCRNLSKLPPLIGNLDQLQEMDLSHTSITELPLSVERLEHLKVLKMVRTYLKEFPEAIKDLKRLTELDFTLCQSLEGPCDITGLISLRILRLKDTQISKVFPRDALHILELGDRVPGQTAS